MTRFALITTTINEPVVLADYARIGGLTSDDVVIVAGDEKTPHSEVAEVLNDVTEICGAETRYIHPSMQTKYASSNAIGWNCIQRRNIALLEALAYQPQYVTTIDDDNYPAEHYLDDVVVAMTGHANVTITSYERWFNIGRRCHPAVFHRGFPRTFKEAGWQPTIPIRDARVGVFASLWTGSPDIDAVERAHWNPNVTHVASYNTMLHKGTWCPFNSQATTYAGELASVMYMWPGVGRYDDIWASFLGRAIMDHLELFVVYGNPPVHQERNEHDIVKDLEQELFGMRHNLQIIEILRNIEFKSTTPLECFIEAVEILDKDAAFLPQKTIDGFRAWIDDVERVRQ